MEQPRGPGLGHVREGLGSRLGRWVLRGHPQAGPGDPTSSYGFCSNGRPIHGDPVLDTVPLYPPEYGGGAQRRVHAGLRARLPGRNREANSRC
jgi:hypothetical protein